MDVLIFDMSSFTNLLIIVPHRGELKKDKLLEVTYIEVLQLSTKDGLNKSTIAEISPYILFGNVMHIDGVLETWS